MQIPHLSDSIKYLSSSVLLISLSIMHSRPIHVANGKISFLLCLSSIPLHTYHIVFTYSSSDGYVGCFHIMTTVNNADINIGVHVSFLNTVFVRKIPRSGNAGMIINTEHLFICLLAICTSSLEKISIQVFSSFCNQIVF